MFMIYQEQAKVADQFLAKQRAKDLATNGRSSIATYDSQRKNSKGKGKAGKSIDYDSSSGEMRHSFLNNRNKQKQEAINKVRDMVKKTQSDIADLNDKGNTNWQLAKQRHLSTDERCSPTANRIVVILAMERFKSMRLKIRQMEKVIVGLKELERNIESNIGKPEDVDLDIKDIMSVLEIRSLKTMRKHSTDELIDQLESSIRVEQKRSSSLTLPLESFIPPPVQKRSQSSTIN